MEMAVLISQMTPGIHSHAEKFHVNALKADERARMAAERQLQALNRKLNAVEQAHERALQAAAPADLPPPTATPVARMVEAEEDEDVEPNAAALGVGRPFGAASVHCACEADGSIRCVIAIGP